MNSAMHTVGVNHVPYPQMLKTLLKMVLDYCLIL